MSGFVTEMMLFCGLGYVVLGPKRMQQVLLHVARAKAEWEKTRQALNAEIATTLECEPKEGAPMSRSSACAREIDCTHGPR